MEPRLGEDVNLPLSSAEIYSFCVVLAAFVTLPAMRREEPKHSQDLLERPPPSPLDGAESVLSDRRSPSAAFSST